MLNFKNMVHQASIRDIRTKYAYNEIINIEYRSTDNDGAKFIANFKMVWYVYFLQRTSISRE